MEKLGIMICGHGSRSKTAEQEFGLLARGLKQRFPETPVEYGFLEYSAPNIHMGLDELRNAGVNHIVAVPGMLFAATHAKNDIPSVLTTYQKKYQHLKISYGRELALHPKMIAAFEARILRAFRPGSCTSGRSLRYNAGRCWSRNLRHICKCRGCKIDAHCDRESWFWVV